MIGLREKKEDLPRGAKRYEGFGELYCDHNGFCPYQWFIETNDTDGDTGYIPICRCFERKVIDDILIKANKNFRPLEKRCEIEDKDQS